MTISNTIIFGPTGSVGSAAARAAQQHGAKVVLAMRDPGKIIPNLGLDEEEAAGFVRIQADLAEPDTIHAAVTKTGAKNAFIYLAYGTTDHMRSSIQALKSAGIDFVVFLSSYSIPSDPKNTPQSDFVAYSHAQIEINLSDIFGQHGFVAVRPAWFASNTLRWKEMIQAGEAKIMYPDATFDWISPKDIGSVCGILAAGGLQAAHSQNVVFLCGPELKSQKDAVADIGLALEKDIKVTEVDEKTGFKDLTKVTGLAAPMAQHLVKIFRDRMGGDESEDLYTGQRYKEGIENIFKYSQRKAMKFEEWIAENKHEFDS